MDDTISKIDRLPESKIGCKQKNGKVFFTISLNYVVVSTLNGYEPNQLKAIFKHHWKTHSSRQVLWEPTPRCSSKGSGVWHPPCNIHTAVTVPKLSKVTSRLNDSQVFHPKNAFFSIAL